MFLPNFEFTTNILIFPRDTHHIVYGALLYVFSLHLSAVLCIHCFRKKKNLESLQRLFFAF